MKNQFLKNITCFGSSTVGERGQIVIPAEIRKKLNIKNGEKFIVFFSPLLRGIVFVPAKRFEKIILNFDKKIARLKKLTKQKQNKK